MKLFLRAILTLFVFQSAFAGPREDFTQAWLEWKFQETCLADSAVNSLVTGQGFKIPNDHKNFEKDFKSLLESHCANVRPREMSGACLDHMDDLMTKAYGKGLKNKCAIRDDYAVNKTNANMTWLPGADEQCASTNPENISEKRLRIEGDHCTIMVECKTDARFFDIKLVKSQNYKINCKKRSGFASCSEMDLKDCEEPRQAIATEKKSKSWKEYFGIGGKE